MRLVNDRIVHVWEEHRAEAHDRTAEQERRLEVIQQKLDRLDEAFLYVSREPARRSTLDACRTSNRSFARTPISR